MIGNITSLAAVRSVPLLLSPVNVRLRQVVTVGLVVAVAMSALLATAQAVDFGAFNLQLSWLNADHRLSVFAVASLLAQAATAAACFAQWHLAVHRRGAWFALGALVGALVLLRGLASFNAAVLALPLMFVFALLSVLTWSNGTARRVVWAALLLLALSLVLHKVGPDADSSTASDYTWSYQVFGIIKHGAELAGWILAATGVVASGAAPASANAAVTSPERAPAVGVSPNND